MHGVVWFDHWLQRKIGKCTFGCIILVEKVKFLCLPSGKNRSFLPERITFELTLVNGEGVWFGPQSFGAEEDECNEEGKIVKMPFTWTLGEFESELLASKHKHLLLLSIVSLAHRWLDSK